MRQKRKYLTQGYKFLDGGQVLQNAANQFNSIQGQRQMSAQIGKWANSSPSPFSDSGSSSGSFDWNSMGNYAVAGLSSLNAVSQGLNTPYTNVKDTVYYSGNEDPIARTIKDVTGESSRQAAKLASSSTSNINVNSLDELDQAYQQFTPLKILPESKNNFWNTLGFASLGAPWLGYNSNGNLGVSTANLKAFGQGAAQGSQYGGPWGALWGGIAGGTLEMFSRASENDRINEYNKAAKAANSYMERSLDNAGKNLIQDAMDERWRYYTGTTTSKNAAYGGALDIMFNNQQQQNMPNNNSGNSTLNNFTGFVPLTTFADGGGIHIKKSKRGTFTAAAKRHGKSVQAFAAQVLANKDRYSSAMVKKANFARNAKKWHHSFGGYLFSEGGFINNVDGGTFSNGMVEIANGGTHEQNPQDGVPMGIAPDGQPNLVEEGEIIYNDYVYSKRLTVPEKDKQSLGLKAKKEISYADAARQIGKESKERPNDPISKNGLEAGLSRLAGSQEAVREKRQEARAKRELANMTPEEVAALDAQIQQQQPQVPVEQTPQQNPMETPMEQPVVAAEGGHLFPYGGSLVQNADGTWSVVAPNGKTILSTGYNSQWEALQAANIPQNSWKYIRGFNPNLAIAWGRNLGTFPMQEAPLNGGTLGEASVTSGISPITLGSIATARSLGDKSAKGTSISASQRPNFVEASSQWTAPVDSNYYDGLNWRTNILVADPYQYPFQSLDPRGKTQNLSSTTGLTQEQLKDFYLNGNGRTLSEYKADLVKSGIIKPETAKVQSTVNTRSDSGRRGARSGAIVGPKDIPAQEKPIIDITDSEDIPLLDEGTVGPSLDAFNRAKAEMAVAKNYKDTVDVPYIDEAKKPKQLPTWMRYAPIWGSAIGALSSAFSTPDDTAYQGLLRASRGAGNYDRVHFNPIGNYLTYNPFDINYAANQLRASEQAAARNIMNTSGGNRGTAMAGILANAYNSQLALGNAYRQAAESNLAQRQQVEQFNRGTNQFNSQGFLQADEANQRARIQAQAQANNLLAQAYGARDAERQRIAAQRSANLTNLFNNIGAIGQENVSRNQLQMLIDSGVFGNMSKGVTKGTLATGNIDANGGKLRKRKKGLTC